MYLLVMYQGGSGTAEVPRDNIGGEIAELDASGMRGLFPLSFALPLAVGVRGPSLVPFQGRGLAVRAVVFADQGLVVTILATLLLSVTSFRRCQAKGLHG